MLKAITRLFGSAPAAPAVIVPEPDPRGAPGTRVYHEFFVEDAPRADGWHWLCRVYAANGAATEHGGVAESQLLARNAAITWAAKTKAGLRGEA
jgi:hypothetical protein